MTVANLFHKKSNIITFWLMAAFIFIVAMVIYYFYSARHPSTDDAYVRAHTLDIAALVSGPVNFVAVSDHQHVTKNQLLFSIDPRPFQYAVNKAEADLKLAQQQNQALQADISAAQAKVTQARASYEVAQKNVPRILTLVAANQLPKAQGVESQGQLETSKAAVVAAENQLKEIIKKLGDPGANNANLLAAKAALDQAKLNLAHTYIVAPDAGYLVNFSVRPGEMIAEANPLFALIESDQWWIDANYKETDLERVRSGQTASIKIDMYPHHLFHGIVQSISHGSGAAFSLLPAENATGNWVKVTQRFPVKIAIIDPDPKYPLRVGASSFVTINTSK